MNEPTVLRDARAHADPVKLRADGLARTAGQLRCALSGLLELPSIAHAKTEDLEQIRALLELCEDKARELNEGAAQLVDQVRELGHPQPRSFPPFATAAATHA